MKSIQFQCLVFFIVTMMTILQAEEIITKTGERKEEVHFNFDTENGHHRDEDIIYSVDPNRRHDGQPHEKNDVKPAEYHGGYSFISADGYEYQVRYKANKNGFQPYVTAHKIVQSPSPPK